MKEIVVISGKGGTGKTSITASFAYLAGKDIVAADCDVDAADMHLLLEPDFKDESDFYSGQLPEINADLCTGCGHCTEICRFDALTMIDNVAQLNQISCEGCAYCSNACPTGAIKMRDEMTGKCYSSTIKTGTSMVHAALNIGAENSGKLVAEVKKRARNIALQQEKDLVLIDGSPGIGCPVVSSLTGASYTVLVTEPSISGVHDLKRVYGVVKKFGIKAGCIINKSDINKEKFHEIEEFLKEEDIDLLLDLPYSNSFTRAMTEGKTIAEYDSKISDSLSRTWKKIKDSL